MSLDMFVELIVIQISIILQTFGLRSGVEVLELYLVRRFLFKVQQFRQVLLNLLLLFFVQGLLLLVQIVDDEKVFGVRFVEVDSVDFLMFGLTRANHVTKVVAVVQDVVGWVHKHFHLIGDFEFDCDQVNVLLLEKNHHDVGELSAAVDASFQNNSVKLILRARLIVVDPELLLCQDLFHVWASLRKSLILLVGVKDIT